MVKQLKTFTLSLFSLSFLLSYPLIILIVFGWFLIGNTQNYLKEVIAFTFFTLMLVSISTCINSIIWRKRYLVLCLLTLSFFLFVKLSFYINYGVSLNASALFVIFETNATEASDFLQSYFNLKVFALLALITLLFAYAVKFNFKQKQLKFAVSKFYKGFVFTFLASTTFFMYTYFSEENIVIKSITTYQDYIFTKSLLGRELAKPLSNEIQNVSSKDEQQTYVVVIGESASRKHMQLYGYSRETNPMLTKIKDSLVVFNDVITSNVHTVVALDKMLSMSSFKFPYKENNASVVQLANAAGFETHWISNQNPVGIHESVSTLIANAAQYKYFLSNSNSQEENYDNIVLEKLNVVLNSKTKKKMIFIHLIGAHSNYNERYPESFNYFKEKPTTDFPSRKAFKLINEYDNAIRYNDFILSEIIEDVNSKRENSYVLYLSDHGDEVYDTIDFVGHSEHLATNTMYEVPFLVWFSKSYANQYDVSTLKKDTVLNRKYILDDFLYSFSDISHITFDGFKPEKSIFNASFKPKKRLIKKGKDYDER